MTLTVGQVAAAADVNVQTIRYYERRGLFAPAERTPTGYRQYRPEAVTRLRFIRHAQELGFSLAEIQELLELRAGDGAACGPVERKARAKITLVERKIAELQRIRRALSRLARACAARRPTAECPILEALEDRHAVAAE